MAHDVLRSIARTVQVAALVATPAALRGCREREAVDVVTREGEQRRQEVSAATTMIATTIAAPMPMNVRRWEPGRRQPEIAITTVTPATDDGLARRGDRTSPSRRH